MNKVLEKLKGVKVVVIGDLMLDHYIWGDAQRISPEAPVPVVEVSRDSYVPGGAANVALNIASLGGEAILCGTYGNDAAGKLLVERLQEKGIVLSEVFARNDVATIQKTRVIVRNQQLCRLDREEAPKRYVFDDERVKAIEGLIKDADAVIVSDYAKGVVSESLIAIIQEVAKKKGVFTAIDPKPKRRLNFQGFDLMTPNKTESLELSGAHWDHHEAFPKEEICKAIWEKYRSKQLIVTLGGEGMLLSCDGTVVGEVPTFAREVFDVSGAGDTVIASLTMALSRGADLKAAAELANTAAGVVVAKVGTATATPEEILNYHA